MMATRTWYAHALQREKESEKEITTKRNDLFQLAMWHVDLRFLFTLTFQRRRSTYGFLISGMLWRWW